MRFTVLSFVVAIVLTVAATVATHLAGPYVERTIAVFYFAAVALSAWYGGFLPGFLATLLSIAAIDFFFLPPTRSFDFSDPREIISLVAFTIVAFGVTWVNAHLRSARERAERAEAEARASEARLRLAVDAAPLLLFSHDRELRYSWVGKLLPSFTPETLLGKTDAEALPGELGASLMALKRKALDSGEGLRTQVDFPLSLAVPDRPNGTWELVVEPVRDALGDVTGVVCSAFDVTHYKLTEDAEARFRISQELSLDGFTILRAVRDESGRIVDFEWDYANPRAAELLKRPTDALVGARLLDLLPGNEATSDLFARYVHVTETGVPHDYELNYAADGIRGWFRNMTVKLGDGVAVSFSDITERKRTEAELARSRDLLEEAQRSGEIGSWEWDLETRQLTWSDELYRIYGLPPGDSPVTYELYIGLIHPDERALVQESVERALNTGESFEFEHRIVRPSGEVRTILGRGRMLRDEQGVPSRMVGSGQDITARKCAEEAQRLLADTGQLLAQPLELQERFESLARLVVPTLADIGVIDLLDPDGSTVRVAAVHRDPERQSLLDGTLRTYPPRQDQGHPYDQLVETGQPLLFSEVTDDAVDSVAQDMHHRELIAALAPRSLILAPIRGREGVLGVLSLTRVAGSPLYDQADLNLATELARRASLALENARLFEQAQEAVRTRDEFISLISHELRNPLASIRGFAQLMRRRAQFDAGAIETILEQTRQMDRLIGDLLDVARLEARSLDLRAEPLDLMALIREATEEAQGASDSHQVRLEAPDGPLQGVWDPDRLRQILRNLLGNAIKYSPGGGEVLVRVSQRDDEAVIEVRDHGLGIPPGQLVGLFQPFSRVGIAAATVKGLGLGLYITRQLVEAHGGRIWAESEGEGRGSTFTFTLPIPERTSDSSVD